MRDDEIDKFRHLIWDYYHDHGRDLPWRQPESDGSFDPYKIMVSEIMLQQTQAARVIPKYQEFLTKFPTVQSLAQASLAEVLTVWSGLGYNRRAKFLWESAQRSTGTFPRSIAELSALPGIGVNTAAAILAYSFNEPVVFIETNIRSVFIHHFFADSTDVHDKELLPLVEAALDREHVREWYWALMDYGVYLKATIGNASRNSKHYAKQSAFHGSQRQIRGHVLRLLTESPKTLQELQAAITDTRLVTVLDDLKNEQLIQQSTNLYRL